MKNLTAYITLLFVFAFIKNSNAQIVISKPNLGFSQACASDSFNTYNVTFTFSPETDLTSSNQFIIELSDETGSFTSTTAIYTSAAGSVTTSPATLNFSFPNTIAGEAYKLRIRSTSPVATSTGSNAFAAYFKYQDEPFTINNLISTAVYCPGESYILTIDNPGAPSNNSPLQYPSLTFNWYKETSETTSVFVASGESLEVSESGTYFVETNYGSCTSNSYSNRVDVSQSGSGTSTSISSSLGNPFCSGNGPTTLNAISGNTYKWYKDGEEISGATEQMYVTSESGFYEVEIDLGSCMESASIELNSVGFTSSIDVPENNTLEEGETLTATVTTDAINPTFAWYRNDSIISGALNNSYEATETGNYKVVITQNSGCSSSDELIFNITEPFPNVANIPNIISPNGDGINDTWIIPQEYVSGTNTEVFIISAHGETVLQTNNYLNNWPQNQLDFKSINPVYYYIIKTENNRTKKGSITVIK
ncbi:gliding motility-associated C-terminal domain-containing protein [Yeosuana sp. MJ-SS3]|uniref:Gliding motility-associated C-terminal domain-containing protein n=1 Tax=Gilvirhabdus luticola TaxID=3079858 RepID=A0ABU3U3W5_9FLAO|nr:gliding motility-associated C-terminal domain-containing protein [Yeosuana sp. MJ-SS3]MDU8885041.1 gliding motility-associated C-terminal domain-containing protein [Yeosuana sp. MJ-SS3]